VNSLPGEDHATVLSELRGAKVLELVGYDLKN
jgi:hypothetical protein